MSHCYQIDVGYKDIILNVLNSAISLFPRVAVFRFDLSYAQAMDFVADKSSDISRFRDLLVQRMMCDVREKERSWGRNLIHHMFYVWVREYGSVNGRKHYHVLLFLNKDIYHSFGNFSIESGNLGSMIRDSWNTATGNYLYPQAQVYFGRVFYITRNDVVDESAFPEFMSCVNYLAKERDKHYGDGYRSIGSSRTPGFKARMR